MGYGIGIIGTGTIASYHAEGIDSIPGAELVAAYALDTGQARAFARDRSIVSHETLDALLDDERVDIVAICTPSGTHLEPALAAAEAGKHVLVEKPLEVTLERCDRLIEGAERAGVKLGTILQARTNANAVAARAAIEAGRLGTPILGSAYAKFFRTQEYYDGGGWKGTRAIDGGGALMNQGIHAVDLLTWLMGPIVRVTARTAALGHDRIEVEDVAVALLEFENGAFGTIEGSTAAYPGLFKRIELCGTGGSIVLEEEDVRTWQFREELAEDAAIRDRFANATTSGGGASDPKAIDAAGHARIYADMVDALDAGRDPLVPGREGRRAVAVIRAIYESAERGAPVEVG